MAIRVFEIAKEYSRSPEEIIKILSKAGIRVSSQTAELNEHELHTLTAKIGKYNLTVVDGDQESQVTHAEIPPEKVRRKKKKKGEEPPKQPPARLAVRVIKKHDLPESELETAEANLQLEEAEQDNKPKPKLLRKANQSKSRLEERIHQLVEKRSDATASPESEQSAAPDSEDTDEDISSQKADKKRASKRAETPVQFERTLPSSEEDRRHRGKTRDERGSGRSDQGSRRNDARSTTPPREGARSGTPPRDGARPGTPPRYGARSGGSSQNQRRYESRNNRGAGNSTRPNEPQEPRGSSRYENPNSTPPVESRNSNRFENRPGGPSRDHRPASADNRSGGPRDTRPGGSRDGHPNASKDNRSGRPSGTRDNRPSGPRDNRPGGPPRDNRSPRDRDGRMGGPPRSGGPARDARPAGPTRDRDGRPTGRPAGPNRDGRMGGPPRDKDNRGGPPPRSGSRPGGYPPSGGPSAGGASPAMPSKNVGNRPRFNAGRPIGKKKKKKKNVEQFDKIKVATTTRVELPTEDLGIVMLSEGATIKELAEKVNRKAKDIIKRLFEKGMLATLNDVLDPDLAIEVAKDFGYLAEIVTFEEDLQIQEEEEGNIESEESEDGKLEIRAPIVTIMGHVDHGKTTLLDAIRKAKVADSEAGGITQHIGAYSVPYNDKNIVFLDTPGHEAFTKMRARGASVTDVVILVVAADDGVKPQTIEAINHAKAAKVPIITCINKIDKPEANPERVKQMLTEHELVVEEFGGESPCVQVSAKKNIGLDDLLEMILLVSEINDYKASVSRRAKGIVIEAKLDRGRGPVATVIIQDGTLRVGEYFITGQTYGKIRAMYDDLGRSIQDAPPSTPVEILGLQEVPSAGDIFQVTRDEASARKISSFRKEKSREDQLYRHKHTSLDQLFSNLKQTEIKDLAIIIKADVAGSIEGLVYALHKIKSDKVNLRIVHQGVGSITENDVLLAVASDGIIIGFNTKPERKAQDMAEHEGIDVRLYSVIYEVVKDIETAMLGLVASTFEERDIGTASVRQIFSVAKLGKVAGCQVDSGVVKREALVRIERGGNELFKGSLQTLKRFRDDVNEVKNGYECGIGIKDFSDIQEGDKLIFYVLEEVQATQL